MLVFILEAAIRSMLMALSVWGAIRLLRVQTVFAQKIAWVLVLASAVAMPMVMRVPFLALNQAPVLPLRSLSAHLGAASVPASLPATATSGAAHTVALRKPSAARPLTETLLSESVLPVVVKDAFARNLAANESSESTVAITPSKSRKKSTIQKNGSQSSSSIAAPEKPASFWSWKRIRTLSIAAYVTVAGILLVRIVAGFVLAFRIRRRASAAEAGLPGYAMDVRASSELSSPVTIGSTVILPADYADWDQEKLRIVLAHEHSHVRQRDFYLQLAAAVHMAIFWFSPLGWWLQRKLSDLGEALSDRAGLEQASDAATYAQILLDFAAKPRTTLAGVAMARSSNLSSRIERILNVRRFRSAFQSSRGHSYLAAILVPASLVAAVALIRFAPVVEAAQNRASSQVTTTIAPKASVQTSVQTSVLLKDEAADRVSEQMILADTEQAPPPPATTADVESPEAPEPPARGEGKGFAFRISRDDDDDDSFAIVRGDNNIAMSGHGGRELKKAREKYGKNFIWFERDGKSYVITDPAVLAQSQTLFKNDPQLEEKQKQLEKMQADLEKQMALIEPDSEKANLPGPEFAAEMAKVNAELAQLQGDKLKKLIDESTKAAIASNKINQQEIQERLQERLGEIQERIGEIQNHLGEMQGKIGERMGELGEKQGKLGERMGALGEEMGKLGEEQGRRAEEDSRKLRSIIDQAIKDGKAKPVE